MKSVYFEGGEINGKQYPTVYLRKVGKIEYYLRYSPFRLLWQFLIYGLLVLFVGYLAFPNW